MYRQEVLSGNLQFISLPDLFQLLNGNVSTGILQLSSPYIPHYGWIYFTDGSPINAACGPDRGLDALYQLFGWIEGVFKFHKQCVNIGHSINTNSMHIVLDALRMMDDGIIKTIGTTDGDKHSGWKEKKEGPPIIKGPLVDYMHIIDEQKFDEGQRVVSEGNYGKWIWVVLQGMVEITQHTPWGPVIMARLGEGSFIGSFKAFQFKESVRSATVTAVGNTYLGLLNTLQLSEEFASLSPVFRRVLLSLSGRMNKISKKVLDLTHTRENLECRFPNMTDIQRDDLSKKIFSIVNGSAHVIGETQQGPIKLVTLEEQDFFGHLPFLKTGHEPFFATVRPSKNLTAEKLDTQLIQREHGRLSGTFRNFIENISTCVSVSTHMACDLYRKDAPSETGLIH